ncbi:hypothetical protein LshimejAT787_0100350 [Lyophyllum shimeji]|uniref:Uncharacterized protein n=1 Tax=Lyophyllum shimeji TaxID=47721 RepID=A0A9P3PC85_LYOSH|nr:hypothetical protein LshimejAT787_0100350 [Lyophyllum shimeji]
MSSIGKFIAYAFSQLVRPGLPPSESSMSTHGLAPSPHSDGDRQGPSASVTVLPRGLVYTISHPNPKAALADPLISLTPARVSAAPAPAPSADASSATSTSGCNSSFDISLISDTSTSTSASDDEDEQPRAVLTLSPILPCSSSHPCCPQDAPDLFSPRRLSAGAGAGFRSPFSHPDDDSPPRRLIGLGISGVPRKDGKPGPFDGLGVVGVRRSSYGRGRNPFLARHEEGYGDDEDDEEDGYASPTPRHRHRQRGSDEEGEEDTCTRELSATFVREIAYTWAEDPLHLHLRVLNTIVEC